MMKQLEEVNAIRSQVVDILVQLKKFHTKLLELVDHSDLINIYRDISQSLELFFLISFWHSSCHKLEPECDLKLEKEEKTDEIKSLDIKKTDEIKSHDIKSFNCPMCGDLPFVSDYFFSEHLLSIHVAPHLCKLCEKRFCTSNALQQHVCSLQLLTDDDIGDIGSSSPIDVEKDNRLVCSICDKVFSKTAFFVRHVERANCDKRRRCLSNSEDKKLFVASVSRHKCDKCDKQFNNSTALKVHKYIHSGVRNFECIICQKRFIQKPHLVMHMRVHSDAKNVVCEHCGKKYKRKTDLRNHRCILDKSRQKDRQTRPVLKSYLCNICGKVLKGQFSLKVHSQLHAIVKDHQCHICNRNFTTHRLLSRHNIVHHSGKKDFQCQICGKYFSLKPMLMRHMIVHSDERPFTCTDCGTSFRQKNHLDAHKLRHGGTKKFVCGICGHAFYEKGNLNQHKRTHSKGEEPRIVTAAITLTVNSGNEIVKSESFTDLNNLSV